MIDRKRIELAIINPEYLKRYKVDYARVVIKKCFDRFFYLKDKLYFIGDDNIYNIRKNKDTLLLFMKSFLKNDEIYFSYKEKDKNNKEKTKTALLLDLNRLLDYLVFNQVTEINYEIDFFRDKNEVKKIKSVGGNKIHIIYNKLTIYDVENTSLSEEQKKEILFDYYEHFPNLDDFLDFVVASRFAIDRKRTYLHLHTRSNWGKSFLMGIFKKLGVGYEIRYSDISENKPVGVNPLEVLGSIVLFLDEFKYFSKEMKKITTEMAIEPKFGFKSYVPVFGKILLSAEESASFTDGVDEQIINRVLKFDYSNEKKFKKLNEREIYKKYGGGAYFNVVAEYVKSVLEKKIKFYIEQGKERASFLSERKLQELVEKYPLRASNLEVELLQIFANFFKQYISNAELEKFRKIKDNIVVKDNNIIHIVTYKKTLTEILKIETDADFFAKAKYKIPIIKELLGGEYKAVRLEKYNNVPIKCLVVDLREILIKLINISKKIEFFDTTITFENYEDLANKLNELIKIRLEKDETTEDIFKTLKYSKLINEIKPVFEGSRLIGVKYAPQNSNSELPF